MAEFQGKTVDIRKPLGSPRGRVFADSHGTGTRQTLEPWFWFFSACPSISFSTDRWRLLEVIEHLGNLDSTLRNMALTYPEHHYLFFHWKPEPDWQQILQPETGFAGTQICVQCLTHLLGKGEKTEWKNLGESQEWTDGGFWESSHVIPCKSIQLPPQICCRAAAVQLAARTCRDASVQDGSLSPSLSSSRPVCVSIWLTTAVHIFSFF